MDEENVDNVDNSVYNIPLYNKKKLVQKESYVDNYYPKIHIKQDGLYTTKVGIQDKKNTVYSTVFHTLPTNCG